MDIIKQCQELAGIYSENRITSSSRAAFYCFYELFQYVPTPFGCATSVSRTADFLYSYLKDFTGSAAAALTAWKLTVSNAIIIADIPASINIHKLISIRYAKLSNQLRISK